MTDPLNIPFFTTAILFAYLLGSIPTGLLLGKLYGIDARNEGSGNIGATNLYRTVGRKVGVMTLVGDCLKGMLPVLFIKYIMHADAKAAALVGLAAFCGHIFPIFLSFKGGKGVATALGVFLALSPLTLLPALLVFVAAVFIWRYISLGSILSAATIAVTVAMTASEKTFIVVAIIIALIVIAKHQSNIKRLLQGAENRFKA